VLIHALYPHAIVKVDHGANAVIVVASPDDVAGIRAVITGIDIKDPTVAAVEAVQVHSANPDDVVARVRTIFPKSRFAVAPNRTIVVAAPPTDMQQIKAVIAAIDTPPASPTPKPVYPTQTIRVLQADPRMVCAAS
jgi:type II secretory pathway component GspD/PulD (secretin)